MLYLLAIRSPGTGVIRVEGQWTWQDEWASSSSNLGILFRDSYRRINCKIQQNTNMLLFLILCTFAQFRWKLINTYFTGETESDSSTSHLLQCRITESRVLDSLFYFTIATLSNKLTCLQIGVGYFHQFKTSIAYCINFRVYSCSYGNRKPIVSLSLYPFISPGVTEEPSGVKACLGQGVLVSILMIMHLTRRLHVYSILF